MDTTYISTPLAILAILAPLQNTKGRVPSRLNYLFRAKFAFLFWHMIDKIKFGFHFFIYLGNIRGLREPAYFF